MLSKRGAIWLAVAVLGALAAGVVLLAGPRGAAAQTYLEPPGPASGVTLANGVFRFTVASSTFETAAVPDIQSPRHNENYRWTRRGLGGPKSAEFTLDVRLTGAQAGARNNRNESLLPNICQVEVQYSYNEGGDVWSDGSAWQVAAYRVWDDFGALDSGGTALRWGAQGGAWSGRKVFLRMSLPEDGTWNGLNRDYRFRFRMIWGSAQAFATYSNQFNDNNSAFSNGARLTDPVCSYYAQDDAWRSGQFGATMTLGVDDIVPAFQLGNRGALRTLGTETGARVLLVPGASIGYTGTDTATSTRLQWRYLRECGNARVQSCQDVPGEPVWRDADVIRAGAEWGVGASGGYWVFQYRLKTAYGGGRVVNSVFPGIEGDLGVGGGLAAPVRAGRIAPQNRTRWLNLDEYGVTSWYKGALSAQPRGYPAHDLNVWEYGEGEILRGVAVADFPPPYIWDRRFSQDLVIAIPTSTAPGGVLPGRWRQGEQRITMMWLGGDDFLDRNIVATTTIGGRAGRGWDSYLNSDQYANRGVEFGIVRGTKARTKTQFNLQDERRLYVFSFWGCQYQPGARWDRYAVQTQSAHDWRLFGDYACSSQAARDLVDGNGAAVGNSTTYTSAGLEITRPRTYSMVVHKGSAGLYQGENEVQMIDNPAGGRLAFLTPGVYEILMQREAGGFFDVELKQAEDSVGRALSGVPTDVELGLQSRTPVGSYVWGANWTGLDGAVGYTVEYAYSAGGENYTYADMTVGEAYRFETDTDTDAVSVRVQAMSVDPGSGEITRSNWSNLTVEYLTRRTVPRTLGPLGEVSGSDAIQEGIGGLFDVVGLEGEGVDAALPVMPVLLCLIGALAVFVGAQVVTGGGAVGIMAGTAGAVMVWSGLGPIFFSVNPLVAYGPVTLVIIAGGLVALRMFKV